MVYPPAISRDVGYEALGRVSARGDEVDMAAVEGVGVTGKV